MISLLRNHVSPCFCAAAGVVRYVLDERKKNHDWTLTCFQFSVFDSVRNEEMCDVCFGEGGHSYEEEKVECSWKTWKLCVEMSIIVLEVGSGIENVNEIVIENSTTYYIFSVLDFKPKRHDYSQNRWGMLDEVCWRCSYQITNNFEILELYYTKWNFEFSSNSYQIFQSILLLQEIIKIFQYKHFIRPIFNFEFQQIFD